MDMRVDNQVHDAATPTHEAALPAMPAVAVHDPATLDLVGAQVREAWPTMVAAGIAGGAASLFGSATRLGPTGRIVATLAGSVAAAAGAAALGAVVSRRGDGPAPQVTGARRAGAPTASADIRADERLRVMTFNAHLGKGPQRSELGDDADMERLARAIARERPDVVLLQEVDTFAVHNGFRDMVGELAGRLGADGAVHTPSTQNITGRQSGTAVLTFHGVRVADARSIISPDVHGDGTLRRLRGALGTASRVVSEAVTGTARDPFDVPEYRPRATADVLVTTPAGTAVRVLSGHWSWPSDGVDHPARQVYPLAGLLDAWDGPTIVGGDFNVKSGTPGYEHEAGHFDAAGMRDAFAAAGVPADDARRNTFGSGQPHVPLDRIYASERLRVEDVRVAPVAVDAVDASDHHPLVVDYQLVREDG